MIARYLLDGKEQFLSGDDVVLRLGAIKELAGDRVEILFCGDERWTKPRAGGKPHGEGPVECAHCAHAYPRFDYLAIVRHCREEHRQFYRHKWDTELATPHVSEEFVPLPEEG